MSTQSKEYKQYSYTLLAISVLLIIVGIIIDLPFNLLNVFIFGVFLLIAENFCIELPRIGAISVSFAIFFAAIVLFGPLTAALMSILIAVIWRDLKIGISLPKSLFNFSQYFIACFISGLAYMLLGGKLLEKAGLSVSDFPFILLPLVISSVLFFLCNTIFVALAISKSENLNALKVWNVNFKWTLPNYLALAFIGVIMAQIYHFVGFIGMTLLLMPLLISRQTFQVYLKLKEVYKSTVKSLVKALEAKDPYTKGHSERVAEYSVNIAKVLQLPDEQIEMIEFAALLHDIGKVGVPRKILSKPSVLTDNEYKRVVEHPMVGAYIIRQIDFLKRVSPAVFHHHEHYDGNGYGGGLVGELIPVQARILAVADAYDAITSVRPYRGAKNKKEALRELLACAGSQFDERIIRALIYSLGISFEDLIAEKEEEYFPEEEKVSVINLSEDIDFFQGKDDGNGGQNDE